MTTQVKRKTNKTTNDPVSDFLTRVRNALLVRAKTVQVPHSQLKVDLAEVLKEEGYIISHRIINESDPATKSIEIFLKYTPGDQNPVISGMRRVSRPGLRKYSKSKEAPRVYNGSGVSILSTNKGLKSDRHARKENLGGEVLCEVW